MPFIIAALVGGAASIGGALINKSSADSATAANKSAAAQERADLAPYRDAGTAAQTKLNAAYGLGYTDPNALATDRNTLTSQFQSSPLYQMTYQPAIDQATQTYDRFASANGSLDSGQTIKAIQDRAAKIGNQTFGDYITGISGIADRGQNAANTSATNTANSTAATNASNQAGANALTAGVLGVGNAVNGAINNSQYLKSLSAYSTPASSSVGMGALY